MLSKVTFFTAFTIILVATVVACGDEEEEGLISQPAIQQGKFHTHTRGCVVATTEGWRFTTQAEITVTALGVFDDKADGLEEAHAVGLWDNSGTLLTSASVPRGTEGKLIDGFRYVKIRSMTLRARQSYIIGAFYAAPLRDAHVGNGTNVTFFTDRDVVWAGQRRIIADSLTCPSTENQWPGVFGPNFLFIARKYYRVDPQSKPPAVSSQPSGPSGK